MINCFKNIFVENKDWVKENIYNRAFMDAKEQFNESFNKTNIKNPSLKQLYLDGKIF